MRIPFFVVTTLICAGVGCGETTNVDHLFEPTPPGSSGKGGTGGQAGGTGGTGGGGGMAGATTGGTGGAGMAGTAGVAGTGGVGGTAGTGATGGTAGTGGASGTGGSAGSIVDAGADVRRDAAADVRDAGKGGIRCGSTTCDPAVAFCCLTSGNSRCLAPTATTCTASSDRLRCDDTADCPAGQICCVTEGMNGNGAEGACTVASLCMAPKQMLCDPAVAMPCFGLANVVCSANGSGLISDYSYCHAP